MSKDAYYFSHDSNARHDPKILEMRSVYGMEGFGWFWVLVEMLREQQDFKLKLCKCNAYAMEMQCTPEIAKKFIDNCINEFELFNSDGTYFWSESLIKRMEKKEERSKKAKAAAQVRWAKQDQDDNEECERNANAMQTQCEVNALKESKVKESKVKKSKEKKSKENKIKYADCVSLAEEEHKKLIDQFGEQGTRERIENLNLYKGSTGKKYASDYLTILNWERKNPSVDKQSEVRQKYYEQQRQKNQKIERQRQLNLAKARGEPICITT